MQRYLHTTLLALTATAFASFAWGQTPPASSQAQETDETAPRAASSEHQRQSTATEADEAMTASETDPAASSTRHQRQSTRTAQGESEHERLMNECLEKVKAEHENITEYQAGKTCRNYVEKQSDSASG